MSSKSLEPFYGYRKGSEIYLLDRSRLPQIERMKFDLSRPNQFSSFDCSLPAVLVEAMSRGKSSVVQNSFNLSRSDFDLFRKLDLEFGRYRDWVGKSQRQVSNLMFVSKETSMPSLQMSLSDLSFSMYPSLKDFVPFNCTRNVTLRNGLLLVTGGSHKKNHRGVNNCFLIKISECSAEDFESFNIWERTEPLTVLAGGESKARFGNSASKKDAKEKTQPMLLISTNSIASVKNLTSDNFSKLPIIENHFSEVCKSLLDPETPLNSFRAIPPMLSSRFDHGLVETRLFIYVIGGRTRQDVKSKIRLCERFDKRKNKWTRIANLPENLCSSSCFEFRNEIYCLGGSSESYLSNGSKILYISEISKIHIIKIIVCDNLFVESGK